MDISIVAVVLVGISNMALGFFWYGPIFGKKWMKEVGLTEKEINEGPGMGYLFSFLGAMFMGAVTSLLVHRLGIVQATDGLVLGLVVGLGYVGTTFLSNYIFANRSRALYLIDAGYQILAVVLAGLITSLIR